MKHLLPPPPLPQRAWLRLLCLTMMGWLALSPAWAQLATPTGSSDFHRLLLCTDGTVKGWGQNYQSQLGSVGVGGVVATPTTIPLAGPAVVVRTATNHSCSYAIGADGSLWAWGINTTGQLGVGSSVTQTATALQVTGVANVVSIAAASAHAAAVCADGTVWTWGNGQQGQIGNGTVGNAYMPQQISPTILHDVRQVACGYNFCLALDASGHVWSWGGNTNGELGIGLTSSPQLTPVQIPGLNNIRHIDADDWSAAAVASTGAVYDWGRNTNGELGLGHTNVTNTPALVGTWPGATAVALAGGCALVTVENSAATICSTLFWGYNNVGQRGNGSATPTFCSTPVAGPSFTHNVQLYGANSQYLSIEQTGTVKTWGYNGNCPLGYTPTTLGVDGGSCIPTAPADACLSVPNAGFPPCGLPQQRTFYQRPGATYEAARHGYTVSPAEIGTYGQLTTIDVSQAPYNGTLAFNGVYHVRGDVKFINGTVTTANGTIFYVDGESGGSSSYYTSIEVINADLRLSNSTLQGQCPDVMWNGVVLGASGKMHTFNGGKVERRCLIQDAWRGVYSSTASSEYYLTYTSFVNNRVGVYDFNYEKNAAQPGEGVQNCSFTGNTTRNTDIGIHLEPGDYTANGLGGNYAAAAFNYNSFTNLKYGIFGFANQLSVENSTFTNNWGAAVYGYYSVIPGLAASIRNNTITLPAAVPAGQSASAVYGLRVRSGWQVENNLIRCLSTVANTPTVPQIGLEAIADIRVNAGNRFQNLDLALDAALYRNTPCSITANSFTNNKEGIRFHNYINYVPVPGDIPPAVTLRCNSFTSTVSGAVGVWVQPSTFFPSALGSTSQPNGNNFSGIVIPEKRFLNDASVFLAYHRYASPQEALGSSTGNIIYNSSNNQSGSVPSPLVSGVGVCGISSATPGVYARSVAGGVTTGQSIATDNTAPALRAAHPNPASDVVTFEYALPSTSSMGRVILRSLMGKVVGATPVQSQTGEVHLAVAALPAGFYTATLEVDGHSAATQKFAVQQ